MFRDIKIPLGNDMRPWNDLFWSFCGKGHEKPQTPQFGGGVKKNSHLVEIP